MKAIFAGSFDPFTLGHREILQRGLKVFEKIIVGVAEDTGKDTAPFDIRVDMARASLAGIDRVEVQGFLGMTTDFCAKTGINVLLRGIRGEEDIEYEKGLLAAYKQMGEVEVVYMFSDLPHISSSRVRQMAQGEVSLSGYVSESIIALVNQTYTKQQ